MNTQQRLAECADLAITAVGAIICALVLVRWWRGGKRDPLEHAAVLPEPVPLPIVWVCVLLFLASGLIATTVGPLLIPAALPESARKNWTTVAVMTLTQSLTAVVCAVALCLRPTSPARQRGGFGITDFGWSVAAWLASMYLCTSLLAWYSLWLIDRLWPSYQLPEHTIFTALGSEPVSVWMTCLALGSAGLIAPIAEELFFRGIVQSSLRNDLWKWLPINYRRWLAILTTAGLFGMMHSNTPHYIPSLVALGIILGYLYERRGTLLAPILVHVLFNAKALLWHYLTMSAAT